VVLRSEWTTPNVARTFQHNRRRLSYWSFNRLSRSGFQDCTAYFSELGDRPISDLWRGQVSHQHLLEFRICCCVSKPERLIPDRGRKLKPNFALFIHCLSQDFKLSRGPNLWYSSGTEPLCELGNLTHSPAKIAHFLTPVKISGGVGSMSLNFTR